MIVYFQPFHPDDVIKGQTLVYYTEYFLWVGVRVRVRVGLVPSMVKKTIM